MRTAERVARLASMALALTGAVILIGAAMSANVHPDADAYWLAAQRLHQGLPLYSGPVGDETQIYRYAPWFAYAWLPLTYLPRELAFAIWRAILLATSVAAVWPLLRRPTPASLTLAVLMGGLLVSNLPAANVTALLVGLLTVTLRTRAGPVAVGIAASLKLFPILLAAGYVAERRWWAAAASVTVAVLLWAQLLLFDLSRYPVNIGGSSFFLGGVSLYRISPVVWAVAVTCLVVALAGLARRRSPWTWLLAAAAIPTVVPRVWLPDAGYLVSVVPVLTQDLTRQADTSAGRGPASSLGTPHTIPHPPPDRG